MSINFRSRISFLFNEGRGIATTQLDGLFVKSIDPDAGTALVQDADGDEATVNFPTGGGLTSAQATTLINNLVKAFARDADTKVPANEIVDMIRYGAVVFDDRDPAEADYTNHRIFFDGIEIRKVVRVPVPGHDRVVNFYDDVSHLSLLGIGIYADRNTVSGLFPFATRQTGLRYYNRSLGRWELWQEGQYWDTRRSIAEPQSSEGSLWIGEWPNIAEAQAHTSRTGQVASYPNADGAYRLHAVSSIVTGTEDGFPL